MAKPPKPINHGQGPNKQILADRSLSARFRTIQQQIDRLEKRIRRLEGGDSPPDSPPDSP